MNVLVLYKNMMINCIYNRHPRIYSVIDSSPLFPLYYIIFAPFPVSRIHPPSDGLHVKDNVCHVAGIYRNGDPVDDPGGGGRLYGIKGTCVSLIPPDKK